MTKLKTSPPSPQPKHFQVSRPGVTTNDGVFSLWNGHSPLKVVPAFLSCTVSPTTSAIWSLLLTSAAAPTAVPHLALLCPGPNRPCSRPVRLDQPPGHDCGPVKS